MVCIAGSSNACDVDTLVEGHNSHLKIYLEEFKLDRRLDIDILQYWKDNQSRFPQLALMARDILSIPITTIAS